MAIRSARPVGSGAFCRFARAPRGAQLLHCAAGTMPRHPWNADRRHGARRRLASRYRRTRRPTRVTISDGFPCSGTASGAASSSIRSFLARRCCGFSATSKPQRVHVVYPGVAADFCGIARRDGDGRTILAVGTVERRKNLEVLVRALAQLPAARIVAVGPHTPYAPSVRAARAATWTLRIAWRCPATSRANGSSRSTQRCAVAAVPSRYEGFGYAAAQALCAGVPCVVSDRSSLPEVARGDARIVDAEDADAWAAAIERRLTRQTTTHVRRACAARRYRSLLVGDERASASSASMRHQ